MKIIFATAAGLLAFQPMMWLIKTWFDPAYQSDGFLVVILVGGLLLWSVTSSPIKHLAVTKTILILLGLTVLVRLIGQVLDINIISTLVLVIDVYILGLLLRLHQRQQPISPFWLAILFAFALPLEQVIQHTISYNLQFMTTVGACQILNLTTIPIQCENLIISFADKGLLVDLPCSGARGLLLLFVLFSALSTIIRHNWLYASVGIMMVLIAAFIINSLRIALLVVELNYTNDMKYHDIVGFTALAICIILIVWWITKIPNSTKFTVLNTIKPTNFIAISFLIVSILIINFPTYPIDVTKKIESPILPNFIGNLAASHDKLPIYEQFTQYGGGAAKANYGPYELLKVTTSSPLRNFHTPFESLPTHKVSYVISTYNTLPTSIYHSIDPQGKQWYIRITFVADNGMTTPYISEAVLHWLQNRNMNWTMVQRIIPFDTPNVEEWDIAISRALELAHSYYSKD